MFARQSLLVLVVVFLCGAIVSLATWRLAVRYDVAAVLRETSSALEVESPTAAPLAPQNPVHTRYDYPALTEARLRADELQADLDKTRALLNQKTTQLTKKSLETSDLKAKLSDAQAFAASLAAEDGANAEAAAEARSEAREELGELRQRLRETEDMLDRQLEQIDMLQLELMQADTEVSELRARAQREVLALWEEKLVIETAASDVLRELGPTAINELTDLLVDERPGVRAWAAFVLGRIGPDARESLRPLRNLLRDEDERVRNHAREAIALIES